MPFLIKLSFKEITIPGPKHKIPGPKKGPKKNSKSLCHSAFLKEIKILGPKNKILVPKEGIKKESKIALPFLMELS